MMKYKIVQNGGFLILFLILAVVNCIQHTKITRNLHEFCLMNRQDYGIGLDENFELNLRSYPDLPNRVHNSKAIQKSKGRCYKRFYSLLPASHFSISIANMKIPKCKGECQCNYFEVSEMGYKTKYCGEHNSSYFESKTNNIYINFMHSRHLTFEVAINFTVERNTYIKNGPPGQRQFIESPYFPSDSPPDYTAEYILQNFDPNGYILLLFLDFEMSQLSYVEVKGHNGSHVDKYDGNTFRPPAIVSQGKELAFKFSANDQLRSYSKFRAICHFEKSIDFRTRESPTICGSLLEMSGGMMEISTSGKNGLFDCIWRLKRSLYSGNNSSFLSVYIIDFKNIGRRASLEFREGLYSNSPVKESLHCSSSNCSALESLEVRVPAAHGLFVRFNGYLNLQSSVKFSFSIFHSGDCAQTEFSCANARCIPLQLHCDGFNHCIDGSDEQNCTSTSSPPRMATTVASWWMPQQPYSVEAGAAEGGLSAASASGFLAILMVGVVGVALVAVALTVVLCRRRRTVGPAPIAMTPIPGIPPRYVSPGAAPPDLPPSYDDFIKSSDFYPPLLFSRAQRGRVATAAHPSRGQNKPSQHHLGASPVSAPSPNESAAPSSHPGSPVRDDTQTWTLRGTIDFKTSLLRRPMSLDSNLDRCYLYLSITRADRLLRRHTCGCRCGVGRELEIENVDISIEGSTSRRGTWSVVEAEAVQLHCLLKRTQTL